MPKTATERAAATLKRWRNDAGAFVREALSAEPEPWQAQALDAIVKHDRLAIRSGHGVGKSALLAWLILWFLLTRFPAKVAATAPTAHQLNDVLWGEVAKWARRLPPALREQLEVKAEKVEVAGARNESFAVARTARKEQPEAFQGFHSDNMLFIAEEASGIEDVIFEVGSGAMSTAGAKTVLTGNPTRPDGFFFEAFHRLRERWWTLKVSSLDVPRAQGHIDDVIATYGAESNAYKVRVLGEFPSSADESVIPLEWIEDAVARKIEPSLTFKPVWGLDVARFGDDRTALAKRRGNALLVPVIWWRGKDTMQTAGLVASDWNETEAHERPSEILVDVIGIGAGVVDRLIELGLPARGINVSEQPAVQERFVRLRDELWWKCREWFQARDCKMAEDSALIAELSSPTYEFTSAGRIAVESKDERKARGLPSPDLADAFILTFAGGIDRMDTNRKRGPGHEPGAHSWMGA